MTKKDAQKIIELLDQNYTMSEIEKDSWGSEIISWDKNTTKAAIKEMCLEYPPYREFGNGRLPEFYKLSELYESIKSSTFEIDYCPCCDNTGWIFFRQINKAVRCDCRSPKIETGRFKRTVHTLQDVFGDYPEAKCDAFECHPTRKFPCPYGSQYYNEKKIEFMRKIRENEKYQAGVKILKGKISENLSDIVEGVV